MSVSASVSSEESENLSKFRSTPEVEAKETPHTAHSDRRPQKHRVGGESQAIHVEMKTAPSIDEGRPQVTSEHRQGPLKLTGPFILSDILAAQRPQPERLGHLVM